MEKSGLFKSFFLSIGKNENFGFAKIFLGASGLLVKMGIKKRLGENSAL